MHDPQNLTVVAKNQNCGKVVKNSFSEESLVFERKNSSLKGTTGNKYSYPAINMCKTHCAQESFSSDPRV